MKTRFPHLIFLAMLVIVSLACSFGVPEIAQLETGPTEILTLNEPRPDAAMVDVTLAMTVGELNLSKGAGALLEGEVQYNVAEWEPTVTSTNDSVTVAQGEADYTLRGFPGEDVVNAWDIRLGNFPMNLTISAGAYDARLDLSGLALRELTIQDGASQSEVRFEALNPEEMESFTYQTGASEIEFFGLANANFAQMTFEGGAGDYTFDFSGDLQRDATVTIEVGFSSVQVVVPAGVSAQVVADSGIGNIDATGTWRKDGDKYVTEGNGPRLTIRVDVDAGELHLVNQ